MIDPERIAEAYLAVWNAAEPGRRLARLAEGWSADARYTDPLMRGEGHQSISDMVGAARAQFPGHGFVLRGDPDGHGSHVRFAWTLESETGAEIARGTDVVRLDGAGRIAEVIGFLDGDPA